MIKIFRGDKKIHYSRAILFIASYILCILIVLTSQAWASNHHLFEHIQQRAPDLEIEEGEKKSLREKKLRSRSQVKSETTKNTTHKQTKPKSKKKPLELSGRVQLLARHHSFQPTIINEQQNETLQVFDIKSARLQAHGEPINNLEYKVSGEFANKVRLKDAYLNYLYKRDQVEIRFGQFHYQFGAENSQSSRYYQFVEKAPISSALTQSRDRGISVRGELQNKRFYYFLGVCNGEGTETPEKNTAFDFLGRVAYQLLDPDNSRIDLWLGASATTGTRDNFDGDSIELESGTGSDAVYFEAELPEAKKYQLKRFAIDGKIIYGPFHAHAEYQVGNYSIEKTASIRGGFITAGYFLTGEKRTVRQGILKRQKVLNPVSANGKGAWEIAARYAWFDVDSLFFTPNGLYDGWEAVDSNQFVDGASSWSFALNWYPDSNTRLMLNYIRTSINDMGNNMNGGKIAAENAFVLRAQLEF